MTAVAHSNLVRFRDCTPQPWANGNGVTRELAAGQDHDRDSGFAWRLSVADVQSGPFSALPGVDRVFTLAAGPTITLAIDGNEVTADPFRPVRFPGESRVECTTPEPTRAVNVMARRGRFSADVSVRIGTGQVAAPLERVTYLVALAGTATIRPARGSTETIDLFDAVRLRNTVEVSTSSGGRVAVVRLTPTYRSALGADSGSR